MVLPQAMASAKSSDIPMDRQSIQTLSYFFAVMSTAIARIFSKYLQLSPIFSLMGGIAMSPSRRQCGNSPIFAAGDILPLMEKIGEFSNICIKGLMAIPPISHISGENQKFFQKMFHLSVDIRQKKYDNVKVDCLSMGMSGDFADAIASGSTMVRVGTAIFGARNYVKDDTRESSK
ncbi:MAG: hypothetical protein EGQ10_03485 [Clostridiales bacterium]|nr:hypothetical protein [Clostridiales bacterium]